MSAISRKSLTPPRTCCKTFSARTRVRAAWCMASQAFRSALQSSWKSFSRWRGRRCSHQFSCRPERRAHASDLWTDEFAFLNQPGQADIQSDLFYDYLTNVEAYP